MSTLSPEQQVLIAKAALTDDQSITTPLSYPFDKFLWLESPAIDKLVSSLVSEINETHVGRKRPKDAEEKLIFFVKLLVLNLLRLHKMDCHLLLAVDKGKGAFQVELRYCQPLLSYVTMIEAYNRLLELGYIEEVLRGFWDNERQVGMRTRIDATPKLVEQFDSLFPQEIIVFTRHPNEETIFINDTNKKPMDYKETPYTTKSRDNLKTINSCLARHWYDLEMTNDDFEVMYRLAIEKHYADNKKPPAVNFTDRTLYRVFSNGVSKASKKNFKQGGRFYGGWWETMPKEYRKYITINQKHTVEVDYSNLHPYMLYAIEGKQYVGDAYAIGTIPRDLAKVAFNKLLNAPGRLAKPDDFDSFQTQQSWKEIVQMVINNHQPIKHYFRTGYGIKLQHTDSQVLEEVLLHFSSRNIPCLPVHDSIIIHHDLKDELQEVMLDAYRHHLGFEINLKPKDNYNLFVESYRGQGIVSSDIESIIAGIDNSQYESRCNAWFSQL